MKSDIPKVLHPAGSGTMLGEIVGSLKEAGIKDIVVVVGYGAGLVRDAFAGEGLCFVEQKELLGSGDALKCAVEAMGDLTGHVLVTCGDTPLITADTYKRLIRGHAEGNASCTLLTCGMEDPSSYGRIVRDERGNIRKIVEEKDAADEEKKIREVNAGTYGFRGAELREFIRDIEINAKKKEFYLTDMADILARNGKKVLSEPCPPDEALGVNSRKDLAVVNRILNQRVIERLMGSGVTIIDPATTYIDKSAVIEKDTTILPCTVIKPGVTIASGCRIGPFARLRPGTTLSRGVEIGNFVELCRTEIGENTKVKHHTYLGDTVVGSNVNIGAGTITANYDGEKKARTVIKDRAFIGVGVILIAPVEIGREARVGAGSVVTKNRNVPDGETVVGIPARPLKKS